MANPKKILLVEDDDIFLFTATFVLNKAFPNAEIAIKHHGQEALDYLMDHEPDLLFLDLNMPKMNGWEFLEELKLSNKPINYPIVIVTSSIDPEDKKKADRNEFVKDYLEKPLNVDILKALVK
jgi:CheY-like chemotaxis protein